MTDLRYNKIKEGAAIWAGYYRWNPHRFVEDYLHIRLKLFQKIIIILLVIIRKCIKFFLRHTVILLHIFF